MSTQLNTLLKKYPPGTRQLVRQMRAVLLKKIPDEKVYLGWSSVYYTFTGSPKNLVIAIGPMPDRINLYFGRGADLADPQGLLEGTGKKMRHVKVYDAKQIRSRALAALIKSAVALGQAEQQRKPR